MKRIFVLMIIVLWGTTAWGQFPNSPISGGTSGAGWTTSTDCSAVTTDSAGCWDSDNDIFYIGTGAAALAIGGTGFTGDVTGVGDCTSGACYDGSSDGGTYAYLYDGTSSYLKMTAGVRTLTLLPNNTNAESLVLTFGDNTNIVKFSSGTGATINMDALALGTASTTAGTLSFKNATNANLFTVTSGVSGAAIGWTLPTAAPGGANYLLNVDADGTMGYTDPSTFAGGVPTTITVANEASDASSFPLFVTAATGDLGPKTNAGLTFNSSTAELGATTVSSTNPVKSGAAGATAGGLTLYNATSGSIAMAPATGALGTVTITVPATSGTMSVLASGACSTAGCMGWDRYLDFLRG